MERWLIDRPRLLATATGLVMAVFAFVLAVHAAAIVAGRNSGEGNVLAAVADGLPTALYLWAVWEIRRALIGIAAGTAGEAAVPRLLRRIGWALTLGGVVRVAGAPLLLWGLRGFGGPVLYFDPGAITLGVVGLLLVLLARLLDHAAAMRDELDAIV